MTISLLLKRPLQMSMSFMTWFNMSSLSDFLEKIQIFQKTLIHKFPFNMQYERSDFLNFIPPKRKKSRIRIVKDPDIWNFLTEIQKLLFCQKLVHARNHFNITPNHSFLTKKQLIIVAIKIRGCGGYVTLLNWKPKE